MKTEIQIRKSKKKTLPYILLSGALLVLLTCLFIKDKTEYPNGKDFYWIGIILSGGLGCKFTWDYFDKRPLYKLDDEGIYVCEREVFLSWTDLLSFKTEVLYLRHVNRTYTDLFDKKDKNVLRIEITGTDMNINTLERVLKKNKLRKL